MKIFPTIKNGSLILLVMSCVVAAKYNIHIEGGDLNLKSWLDICKADENMQHIDKFETINPKTGEKIIIQSKNSCLWLDEQSGKQFWFYYSNERITIGADMAQVKKAKQIAIILNAKVVGDEGEEY